MIVETRQDYLLLPLLNVGERASKSILDTNEGLLLLRPSEHVLILICAVVCDDRSAKFIRIGTNSRLRAASIHGSIRVERTSTRASSASSS